MSNPFQYIFNLHIDRVESDWEKRGFRIVNTLIFSLGVLMLLFTSLSYVINLSEARPIILLVVLITIVHFWVAGFLPFKIIKLYASLIPVLLILTISVFIIGEGGADRFYFACSLILPMLFYREKKWWLPLVILNIAMFGLATYLQNVVEPMAELKEADMYFYSGMNGLAICLLILIMLKVFKMEIEGFQDTITDQKKSLEIKNTEITESINYAKGIQEAILPSTLILEEVFTQGFVTYLPKDIVAGDFYWIEKYDKYLYFSAADCTGHGVPGAMVSVVCSNALQQALFEHKSIDVNQILEKTSELVSATFAKSEREIKDGMDIGICRWDETTRTIQFSGANNPFWVISEREELNTGSEYKSVAEGGKFLHEIKGTKRPVGNSLSNHQFELHTITLHAGDEVILQTDGFADQFGGPRGKKYKYSTFKKFLLNSPSQDRKSNLIKEFKSWKGTYEQLDDVCVVGFRVKD